MNAFCAWTNPSVNGDRSDKTSRHDLDRRALTSLENVGHEHNIEGLVLQRGWMDEDGGGGERERECMPENL